MPTTAPTAPAIAVFVATVANCTSVAAKVDAALKPNQPNNRMKQPSWAIGMLCGGIARGLTVGAVLSDAWPEDDGACEGGDAADGVDDT